MERVFVVRTSDNGDAHFLNHDEAKDLFKKCVSRMKEEIDYRRKFAIPGSLKVEETETSFRGEFFYCYGDDGPEIMSEYSCVLEDLEDPGEYLSKVRLWNVIYIQDEGGGFGDAVETESVVGTVRGTRYQADQFIKKWDHPEVYATPYAKLYHNGIRLEEVTISDIETFEPYET